MPMPRNTYRKEEGHKRIIIMSAATIGVAIIAFLITYNIYAKKVQDNVNSSLIGSENFTDLSEEMENLDILGEVNNELNDALTTAQDDAEEDDDERSTDASLVNSNNVRPINTPIASPVPAPTKAPEPMPEFAMPIEGEIIRNFAKETLVYSPTLEEWVPHNGIDIKADRAAVIKASENGVVESIKNDPRYGISVIISHGRGFKTIYSNLLSADFVAIGENVVKGQTVGTVGSSATFEILDEPHCHFELIENGEHVDPCLYIK